MEKHIQIFAYLGFFVALLSTLISLYLSQFAGLIPCELCWLQRIAMFPLVPIFIVGILRKDKGLYLYTLPISIIGMLIAIYHNLLVYKVIPESLAPCTLGVSCTLNQTVYGFITIPLLSFASFTFITICMIIYAKLQKEVINKKSLKSK